MGRVETTDSLRLRTSTGLLLLGVSLLTFVSVIVPGTLPMVGTAFHANNSELGPVLSAFVIGFAIFQIPAGLLALRVGARRVYLLGVFLAGVSTVASGFSRNLLDLGFLRFLAGSGWGIANGSVYNLLALYYPQNQRGKWFGLFYGISNGIGGVVGLPLSTALGLTYSWTVPYTLLGITIIGVLASSLFILPPTTMETQPKPVDFQIRTHAKKILTSRSILALSIGLIGFGAAASVASDYFIQYVNQVHPNWSVGLASYILATGLGAITLGGLLVAWLANKRIDKRFLLIGSAFYVGLDMIIIPYVSWQIIWGLYATGGTLAGAAFSLAYLIPTYLQESQGEGVTLTIGIVSTFQYGSASVFLTIFGLLSVSSGYTFAWVLTGVLTIVLLPVLFLIKKNPADLAEVPEIASSQ